MKESITFELNQINDRRVIDVEFIYQPRPSHPTDPRSRDIFDAAFSSRLAALDPGQDAVLLIADSVASVESLQLFIDQFPNLRWAARIANPTVITGSIDPLANFPVQFEWPSPENWEQFRQSDRWARLDAAFEFGGSCNPDSYLIMPAHDAFWGSGLLKLLRTKSTEFARGGLNAAVSPYSYYRHSAIDAIQIAPDIINLINIVFNRDSSFPEKLSKGHTQGFWGKTALLPCAMSTPILNHVDQTFFEDDAEIDRAIHRLGYASRGIWIADPGLYRQSLPVFDEAAARRVILRSLHYSLPAGGSFLLTPLDEPMCQRLAQEPAMWRANNRAEQLIHDCQLEIKERLEQFGASWVDWGAYRYVTRVGDPEVKVWRQKVL